MPDWWPPRERLATLAQDVQHPFLNRRLIHRPRVSEQAHIFSLEASAHLGPLRKVLRSKYHSILQRTRDDLRRILVRRLSASMVTV